MTNEPARQRSGSCERLSPVGAERSPFSPDGVESLSELSPETGDGIVKFDPVVGIRDRVGVLEDAVRTGDEAAGTLEIAVLERENPCVEERVRAQVGVVVCEDPFARHTEASLGLVAVAAGQSDI